MPEVNRAMVKRPCGMETEFGIMLLDKNKEFDQASSGYVFFDKLNPAWIKKSNMVPWDPSSRMAGDKDVEHDSYFSNPVWCQRSNLILENGARFYLDSSQPEISTPLCLSALELVKWNRACYLMLSRLCQKQKNEQGLNFKLFRNNVAGRSAHAYHEQELQRVSYGCHENYTTWRSVDLDALIRFLGCSWFIARTPIIGAGKVGCDANSKSTIDFQISQRADFFSEIQNFDTVHNRPLYNMRDVPYADAAKFRRVHVITGDSNMLQLPEYLKVGLTSIALMMIEDGQFPDKLEFLKPVCSFQQVSWDTKFLMRYYLAGFKTPKSIVYVLQTFRDYFAKYLEQSYPDCKDLLQITEIFSDVLDLLAKKDMQALNGKLDWVSKYLFMQAYCERSGKTWKSPEIMKADYLYHDNDHENGIFFRGTNSLFASEQKLVSEEAVDYATKCPPDSRSRWIVETIKKFYEALEYSNYWDKISVRNRKTGIRETISFPDPTRRWLPEDEAFFQAPWEDFIKHASEARILRMENERAALLLSPETLSVVNPKEFWQRDEIQD